MTNPLASRREKSIAERGLEPGEMRTMTTKDGRSITIVRTDRPYAYDLADAYNNARERNDGWHWYVTPNDELRCDYGFEATSARTKQLLRSQESERSRWLRNHLDNAA